MENMVYETEGMDLEAIFINTCSICLDEAEQLHILKDGFVCDSCVEYVIKNC